MSQARWSVHYLLLAICLAFLVPECLCIMDLDSECDCDGHDLPYSTLLDDTYQMRYNADDSRITFCVRVKTTGWVGFGLSPKGKMKDSDIVVGWVNDIDGKGHIKDCHGIGNRQPIEDYTQDWTLHFSKQEAGWTTLVMSRKLDTCDANDFKILNGTTRVIWSYNANDPKDDVFTLIQYHNKRGVKSLLLLDPPLEEHSEEELRSKDSTLRVVEFKMNKYQVPTQKTTYGCAIVILPKDVRETKHQLIRWEPLVYKKRYRLIHHIVIYYCLDNKGEEDVNKPHICNNDRTPSLSGCERDIFLVWAVGGTPYDYPKDVGLPIGGDGRKHYFKIEIHYDNIEHTKGLVDESGFRLFLTRNYRKHDAGLLQLGIRIDPNLVIPPKFDGLLTRGYCRADCLEEYMTNTVNNSITVFAGMLHTHLTGQSVYSRILRGGIEQRPVMEDKFFDFDYQEFRALPEHRVIQPGDTIVTDCIYNTEKRGKRVTYGGFPTDEEMCLVFYVYYPELNISACLSSVDWSKDIVTEPTDFNNTALFNFDDGSVRDKFVAELGSQNIINWCYGLETKKFNGTHGPQPVFAKEYKHPSTCPNNG